MSSVHVGLGYAGELGDDLAVCEGNSSVREGVCGGRGQAGAKGKHEQPIWVVKGSEPQAGQGETVTLCGAQQ